MQKDINVVEYKEGKIILENDNDNSKIIEKLNISPELLNLISEVINTNPDIKNKIEEAEEVTKSVWEIVISPELQEGIDNGSFKRDKFKLEIRDSKTGRYVGKAKLKEAESIEKDIIQSKNSSPISNITRSICSISGQIQMAEISKKLDIINDKIDSIIEQMWIEKVSELKGKIETIEMAFYLMPDEKALNRINSCIESLTSLAKFFESSIERILNKRISYSLFKSFIEGFNIFEIVKKNRDEYNKEYLNEIKKFLEEYGFLIDLYSQTMALLGSCYQTIHGYDEGIKYYNEMYEKVSNFSFELSNKLIYLLDVKDVEDITLLNICKKLNDRNISILKNIEDSRIDIENIYIMQKRLLNQYDNSKILLYVETQELLEGESKNGSKLY